MANISDTPLVSMVLVDDENNRTTFTGPIINDFTITEDLQSKITQLTTLATNISNLQTRLTNITNILNTQNIEFTDDSLSDVSSAGSKLYIRPKICLSLIWKDTEANIPTKYINITNIFTTTNTWQTEQEYNLGDIYPDHPEITEFNCYVILSWEGYVDGGSIIDSSLDPVNMTMGDGASIDSISIGGTSSGEHMATCWLEDDGFMTPNKGEVYTNSVYLKIRLNSGTILSFKWKLTKD